MSNNLQFGLRKPNFCWFFGVVLSNKTEIDQLSIFSTELKQFYHTFFFFLNSLKAYILHPKNMIKRQTSSLRIYITARPLRINAVHL